ncbi:hypothetical protein MMC16_001903 [Acarospora aff. strigata]|nr:hypothetical protein [Acarospora aff. strigata]
MTISKSAISFVAIPSAVAKAVGNVDVGDIVVNLDSNALSKLKTAGDSIKAACAKLPLAKRSSTCVSTIIDAATSSKGEYVGTIRLIGTSIEEWKGSLAPPPPPGSPPPAPGPVVPKGTVFAAPAWAGAAAAGEHAALAAGPATVAVWLMNYVISGKEAASLNLRPVGKNSKGCQKSTVSRCTNTCYARPYAADYSIKTSSSCSSACTTVAACSAKGTTTTTTIKPSATYEIEQNEPESYNDRFQVPQAGLGPLADLTMAYCNLGLFDTVKIPGPKCNNVKGNSFVSQKAAADAAYKFCSEPKNRSGKAKENPLAWFNQNSADQLSFSIQFNKDVVFSKSACLAAVLPAINGCSIPGNDNKENHKYGGSVDHRCGATFKFSPNPQSTTTCDTSKVAPVPYNVFAGANSNGKVTPPVYGKFCPIMMKDTTKGLGHNVGVDGNMIPNLARMRQRTPPPDPNLHNGDTFGLIFKPKKDGGACIKNCMDGFASLANSPREF